MTDTHWQRPQSGNVLPSTPGWMPGQPGTPVNVPPPAGSPPAGKPRIGLIVGLTAIVCTLIGAAAGSITGVLVTREDKPAVSAPAPPPGPTAEQVNTQTRDLCTRFVAAFSLLPKSNARGLDVLPVASYAQTALEQAPAARAEIRNAISDWLREARLWIVVLGNETPQGYIDYPAGWNGDAGNAASKQAIALCRTGP